MAVTSELIRTSLRLTDDKKKSLAYFSKVNPECDAEAVADFATAISGLRTTPTSLSFLVKEYELTGTP